MGFAREVKSLLLLIDDSFGASRGYQRSLPALSADLFAAALLDFAYLSEETINSPWAGRKHLKSFPAMLTPSINMNFCLVLVGIYHSSSVCVFVSVFLSERERERAREIGKTPGKMHGEEPCLQ